jgi:dienelactone hydrolase
MERLRSRCDLHLYEGQGHGFFNHSKHPDYYKKTVRKADEFLVSIGWLSGEVPQMTE